MAEEGRAARFTLSSAAGLRIIQAGGDEGEVARAARPTPDDGTTARSTFVGHLTRTRARGAGTRPLVHYVNGKPGREWHLIDAAGMSVATVAMAAAALLRGKGRLISNEDVGAPVVVVNAAKIDRTIRSRVTRPSSAPRTTYFLKKTAIAAYATNGPPAEMISKAVEHYMPKGSLGRRQIARLYIYDGIEHDVPPIMDEGSGERNRHAQSKGSAA